MTIDWGALALVSIVSLVATITVVTITALGVAAFGGAQDRVKAGQSPSWLRFAGFLCVTLAGAAVLYGIYLIIPGFH